MLRKFLVRGFLFCIPFYLWGGAVFLVDPFNYFHTGNFIPTEIKEHSSRPLNILMYSVFEEVHDPCENLLIGDSRMLNLSRREIEQVTGERYLQLGSNALKLNEAIELFWLANKIRKPKRVYFGLNFNMYNRYAYADRVKGVKMVLKNPVAYLFDRSVTSASIEVLKSYFSGGKGLDMTPPMSVDEFWRYILQVRSFEHYGKYGYPQEVFDGFRKIVDYGKKNGIEIVMIIVPHHVEFQRKVYEFKLGKEYRRFKQDMARLNVPVFDYDYENAWTADRKRFTDPLHCDPVFGDRIIREVWLHEKPVAGRLLTPDFADHSRAAKTSASGKGKS